MRVVVYKGVLTSIFPFNGNCRTFNQLKAIEELKDKAKGGAKLETTQYKKIETEIEIRKELAAAIVAAGGAA